MKFITSFQCNTFIQLWNSPCYKPFFLYTDSFTKEFHGHFPIIPFLKLHGKKIWEPHNMMLSYLNLCFKGTALYLQSMGVCVPFQQKYVQQKFRGWLSVLL